MPHPHIGIVSSDSAARLLLLINVNRGLLSVFGNTMECACRMWPIMNKGRFQWVEYCYESVRFFVLRLIKFSTFSFHMNPLIDESIYCILLLSYIIFLIEITIYNSIALYQQNSITPQKAHNQNRTVLSLL